MILPYPRRSITSHFMDRRGSGHHYGTDFQVPYWTEVPAIFTGTIAQVGGRGDDPLAEPRGFYVVQVGTRVNPRTGKTETVEARYYHLAQASHLARRAKVRQGQRIGHVGQTGAAHGHHLHLELLIAGRHVDPEKYLEDAPWT